MEWQGYDPNLSLTSRNTILLALHHHWKQGVSYPELAVGINILIKRYLIIHYDSVIANEENLKDKKPGEGSPFWRKITSNMIRKNLYLEYSPTMIAGAAAFMKAIVNNHPQVQEALVEGLLKLDQGETPFRKGEPISEEQVSNALRTWRRRKNQKKIISKSYIG